MEYIAIFWVVIRLYTKTKINANYLLKLFKNNFIISFLLLIFICYKNIIQNIEILKGAIILM